MQTESTRIQLEDDEGSIDFQRLRIGCHHCHDPFLETMDPQQQLRALADFGKLDGI